MAYGFSVFWLPLSSALGVTQPVACPDMTLGRRSDDDCDWRVSTLGWMYTLFFVLLGSSAALCGGWLEREGRARPASSRRCCWCGGFVHLRARRLSPPDLAAVARLRRHRRHAASASATSRRCRRSIKWFPDRRGMATGMAIMGFGGGAMIGAPLADLLMTLLRARRHRSASGRRSWCSAAIYFVVHDGRRVRLSPASAGLAPRVGRRRAAHARPRGDRVHRAVDVAWRTRQFWLLWAVLCLNVSAGIGVIGMASPMIQEIFRARVARRRRPASRA